VLKKFEKHPRHPVTDAQKDEFYRMWSDENFTNDQLCRYYGGVNRSTLMQWATSLGHPNRTESARMRKTKDQIGKEAQIVGTPPNPGLTNPKDDEEIAEALKDVIHEARSMGPHTDLLGLRRKAVRGAALTIAKAPTSTWFQVGEVFDRIARLALNTSRVEAQLPEGQVDEVALRKQAAAALLREMKAVLNADEQAVLSKIVKVCVERIKAQGADGSSVTAEVEGAEGGGESQ
jgi:hypothetical protein